MRGSAPSASASLSSAPSGTTPPWREQKPTEKGQSTQLEQKTIEKEQSSEKEGDAVVATAYQKAQEAPPTMALAAEAEASPVQAKVEEATDTEPDKLTRMRKMFPTIASDQPPEQKQILARGFTQELEERKLGDGRHL